MKQQKMSFGKRLVDLLKQENVQAIFSQGDLSMRDIQKHAEKQGLKIIGPRHEAAAVFMADAYYRMSGVPQVAMGAMGPGQANLLPAVVCAAQEHIPVIVLGASRQLRVDSGIRRSRFLHAPVMDCFSSICKFAAKITHPGELDELVREAFRQALSGTPGPVYLEYDFVMHEAEYEFPMPLQRPEQYRVVNQPVSREVIQQALAMLANASCPVLLGGTGIHTSQSYDQFEQLARLLQCPVITTIGGSGTLPETDKQWVSYYSQTGQKLVKECDLILALGTSIPETLNYGRQRYFYDGDESRKWILVEQDVNAFGINRPIDLAILGKIEDFLPKLCTELERNSENIANERFLSWRNAYVSEYQQKVASLEGASSLNPSKLMVEAREAVPDNAIIVADSGLIIMHQLAYFEKRSRHFLWTSKYGHLGSGMPYAIGAKLQAGRDKPVCLISGDGGIGFHFMEFETAVRHQLGIVVIVSDDQALGAEMQAHLEHIGHTIEVTFAPVRYDLMAAAMGGHGEYVDKAEEIQPAVQRAFASGKPAIVQVKVDPQSSVKYPVPYAEELMSWLSEDVNPDAAHAELFGGGN